MDKWFIENSIGTSGRFLTRSFDPRRTGHPNDNKKIFEDVEYIRFRDIKDKTCSILSITGFICFDSAIKQLVGPVKGFIRIYGISGNRNQFIITNHITSFDHYDSKIMLQDPLVIHSTDCYRSISLNLLIYIANETFLFRATINLCYAFRDLDINFYTLKFFTEKLGGISFRAIHNSKNEKTINSHLQLKPLPYVKENSVFFAKNQDTELIKIEFNGLSLQGAKYICIFCLFRFGSYKSINGHFRTFHELYIIRMTTDGISIQEMKPEFNIEQVQNKNFLFGKRKKNRKRYKNLKLRNTMAMLLGFQDLPTDMKQKFSIKFHTNYWSQKFKDIVDINREHRMIMIEWNVFAQEMEVDESTFQKGVELFIKNQNNKVLVLVFLIGLYNRELIQKIMVINYIKEM